MFGLLFRCNYFCFLTLFIYFLFVCFLKKSCPCCQSKGSLFFVVIDQIITGEAATEQQCRVNHARTRSTMSARLRHCRCHHSPDSFSLGSSNTSFHGSKQLDLV